MVEIYPKISIVTPNYNQVNYIERTILSVIGQNYPNLEYIIIDGGSTDGSVEIIKKYEGYLTYWISEPDKGMYDAICKGFNYATGSLLAWINSDDFYLPYSFFTVADIFDSFSMVNWLQGSHSHADEQGRIVSNINSRYWTKYDFLCRDFTVLQQESIFFRSHLWQQYGPSSLNSGLKLAGDFCLWYNFFKSEQLYTTTAPIGCFRMRSEQLSAKSWDKYIEEVNAIYDSNEGVKINHFQFYIYHFLNKIKFFKILRRMQLEVWFKQKFFNGPGTISFNRSKQCFELH